MILNYDMVPVHLFVVKKQLLSIQWKVYVANQQLNLHSQQYQDISDKPTNVNNVETFANVPVIIKKGAEWFSYIGTEKSKGTKVFALQEK